MINKAKMDGRTDREEIVQELKSNGLTQQEIKQLVNSPDTLQELKPRS